MQKLGEYIAIDSTLFAPAPPRKRGGVDEGDISALGEQIGLEDR